MKKKSRSQRHRYTRPRGFTLVEMLVAVALVLLMMTMFTAIFSLATESLSTQRALSDNDQKSRMLMTVLREDIKNRTFRYVFPYTAGEETTKSITSRDKRREGYFYISCNDLTSGADDLLQFTASVPAGADRYAGAAAMLYDQVAEAGGQERRAALQSDPNQPEFDDGQLVPNGIAESSAAEIAYFIRNGNLYRRVMLIREPRTIGGGTLSPDPNSNVSGNPLFPNGFSFIGSPQNISQDPASPNYYILPGGSAAPSNWNVTASNDFWKHFDFSASSKLPAPGIQFHSLKDLENTSVLAGGDQSLGIPSRRFGFSQTTGLSREHDQLIGASPAITRIPNAFIGRFLQAETSSIDFNWPLASAVLSRPGFPGNGNPMDLLNSPMLLDETTGFVSDFASTGTRISEDMILPNVHEFRVEVWDEAIETFTAIGYGNDPSISLLPNELQSIGDFHIHRRINETYGPRNGGTLVNGTSTPPTIFNPDRVFDTWHPSNFGAPSFAWTSTDTGTTLAAKQPPFVPYRFYPPRRSQNGPSSNDSPDPLFSIEPGTGFRNRGYRIQGTTNYQPGDVVFPDWDDKAPIGTYQSREGSFELAYRCVSVPSGMPAADAPPIAWPTAVGARVTEPTSGIVWEAIDNRRPLKAVRVTLRFQNEKNLQIKELPIVLSLQD